MQPNYTTSYTPKLAFALLLTSSMFLGGCGSTRMLPWAYMPDAPKECETVMGFEVEPLPKGKSTATKLAVDMANEGSVRTKEHEIAKVCAEYALRTAGTMKDKDRKPAPGEPVVDAASTTPKATRTARARSRDEAPAASEQPGS